MTVKQGVAEGGLHMLNKLFPGDRDTTMKINATLCALLKQIGDPRETGCIFLC